MDINAAILYLEGTIHDMRRRNAAFRYDEAEYGLEDEDIDSLSEAVSDAMKAAVAAAVKGDWKFVELMDGLHDFKEFSGRAYHSVDWTARVPEGARYATKMFVEYEDIKPYVNENVTQKWDALLHNRHFLKELAEDIYENAVYYWKLVNTANQDALDDAEEKIAEAVEFEQDQDRYDLDWGVLPVFEAYDVYDFDARPKDVLLEIRVWISADFTVEG